MPLAVAATAASSLALALAPPAGAVVVVVRQPEVGGPADTTGVVVVAPDGSSRRLARHRVRAEDASADAALSPDGRFLARRSGQRIVLVPTDGGPARVLGARGARALGSGSVWWDADGRQVHADAVVGAKATRAMSLRCVVASGPCATVPAGGLLLTPTITGASVWTTGLAERNLFAARVGSGFDLSDATDGWLSASRADVRRARRALARPTRTRQELRGSDGRVVRGLWAGRRSFRAGVDEVAGVAASPVGALLTRQRVRLQLQTRTRGGRTQLRLRTRDGARAWWRVDERGARTPVRPRSPEGDALEPTEPAVGIPGGWALQATSRGGRTLVAVLTPDGTVRRPQTGGGPVTSRTLHAALGLPADEAPNDVGDPSLAVAGYEAGRSSLIVQYRDATGRAVVARVPVDGGAPPRLVYRSTVVDQTLDVAAR